MKVKALLLALKDADPEMDVDLEYECYGEYGPPRAEDRPLRSVEVDQYSGVTLSSIVN